MGNLFSDDFLKAVTGIQESVKNALTPVIDFQISMRKTFLDITQSEGFINLRKSFAELGNQLREAAEEVDQFRTIIVELGYPPHESLPISDMRMIVQDYNEHGVEYVRKYIDSLMEDIYDDAYIEELTMEWESKELVSDRIPILRTAVRCHKQQAYYASVPTLLPQLEGTIAKGFKQDEYMTQKHLKVYLKKLLKVKNPEDKYLSFEDALETYYLQYILVPFEHGQDVESDISRHAILHGGYVEYGHRNISLKLILLYDFLLSTLSNLSEETIRDAKEEIYNKKK
ncbi:hypothetical protein NDQ57_03360 [Rossellomorea marisflavi]|uniref:hypothetical protein n=1 Tax=Rossellomorea marisflavi TaxID=189381 RepID=UPI00203C7097|nr:hypothetical protein [Rossellomorea marisflavi]MCM2603740.1 hypothetical protein [Rossellomorea marisflavi]